MAWIILSKGTFMFHHNMTYDQGGAVHATGYMITMWNCDFISNRAKYGVGGAIVSVDSTVMLTNNDNPKFPIEFRNNVAQVVCYSFCSVALDHLRNETKA
jgi:hypothetical protein